MKRFTFILNYSKSWSDEMKGYEEVSDLKVKQLWVVMQNVLTAVHEKRDFWLERRGDKVYLCWE